MEETIDSCISNHSIGYGVNFLSNEWGRLEGGGTNIYNGDSLFYYFKQDKILERPEFYVWLQNFKLKLETDLPGNPFFSKFRIEIQFFDKNIYDNLLKDIIGSKYQLIKEIKEQNYLQKRYQNKKYDIDLITINSEKEITYLFSISNW